MPISGASRWSDHQGIDVCEKAKSTEWRYYDTANNLLEDLYLTIEKYPNKIALKDGEKFITYQEMATRIEQLASGLQKECQVLKGDLVALLMVNSIEFCLSFYAALYLGAIVLPLSTKLKSTELDFMLEDAKPKVLIANPEWLQNIKSTISRPEFLVVTSPNKTNNNLNGNVSNTKPFNSLVSKDRINPVPVSAEDGAVIMYTSGTTGKPKGAYLTHFNLLQGVVSYQHTLKLTSADSTLICVPIFHITGLTALFLLFMHLGGTVHLLPYFNAKKTLDILATEQVTFFHAAPTVYIMLLAHGSGRYQLNALRKAACGGGAISGETISKLKKWLPQLEFHTVYGLTESSSPAILFPGDVATSSKIGSSGIPIPVTDCKIIDEDGREIIDEDRAGELCIRGPQVIQKYWNNANSKAFDHGWFKTGDIAMIDCEGYVYIQDRIKDMINRGGEKVYSLEVENVIFCHPKVKEVAVIGAADQTYGEVVRAVVVLTEPDSVSAEEIKQWVRNRLAKYKTPSYIDFVNDLPKNANGKIDKKLLRELYY
jgi:long-chain acyl-CoA synthetase